MRRDSVRRPGVSWGVGRGVGREGGLEVVEGEEGTGVRVKTGDFPRGVSARRSLLWGNCRG